MFKAICKAICKAVKNWLVQTQPAALVLSVKGFYVAGRRNLQSQAELFWDSGETRTYNGRQIKIEKDYNEVWWVTIDDGRRFTLDKDDYKTILV
jgi:hypothetical protein